MKLYKGYKITVYTKESFSEVRDWDGLSSRGTGAYERNTYNVYQVNRREFRNLSDAKAFINSILNRTQINKLLSSLRVKIRNSAKLAKEIRKTESTLYKLGLR